MHKKKQKMAIAAGILLSLSLSACGTGNTDQPQTSQAVTAASGETQETTVEEESRQTVSGSGITAAGDDLTFPLGMEINSDSFTGNAYLSPMINNDEIYNFPQTNNVTFEPGARSAWHSHGGMILLVTGGVGYYQEEGKPAQIIRKGDVVECAPGVKHWHGGSADTSFAHIAANTNPELTGLTWFDRISDEEYSQLPTEKAEAAAHASGQETAAEEEAGSSILVAYFTMPETDGVDAVSGASRVVVDGNLYGNTQYLANLIQERTGGELFEIETVQKYPGEHEPLIDQAAEEQSADTRPELAAHIENLDDYDVIFLGYPNWWADLPMPLYTFWEEYDFSGKTIIPFNSHGGSRFSGTIETIQRLQPGAEVITDGYTISRDSVGEAGNSLGEWLTGLGY